MWGMAGARVRVLKGVRRAEPRGKNLWLALALAVAVLANLPRFHAAALARSQVEAFSRERAVCATVL